MVPVGKHRDCSGMFTCLQYEVEVVLLGLGRWMAQWLWTLDALADGAGLDLSTRWVLQFRR